MGEELWAVDWAWWEHLGEGGSKTTRTSGPLCSLGDCKVATVLKLGCTSESFLHAQITYNIVSGPRNQKSVLEKTLEIIPMCSQGQDYDSLRRLAISWGSLANCLGIERAHSTKRQLARKMGFESVLLIHPSVSVWKTKWSVALEVPEEELWGSRRTWTLCALTGGDYTQTKWPGPWTLYSKWSQNKGPRDGGEPALSQWASGLSRWH